MCVDVMPGLGDPATQQLPQQPIHRACLPRASINGAALGLVPNPYEFTLEGLDFIITSGQNITDLRRLSGVSSGCDFLELLLKWQHLSPTCPDTVDGFPFIGRDPLVIDKCFPHIMIAGNQPRAESRWLETDERRTLLLSLPKFSRTHMVTLLNLTSMEVSYRYFGV
uniref:DNA_pol_E_B domain-containing protein n=1 Tax=Heterorhabditis bacteriophora TaxID=37862 RepID=A0A1I7XEB6_HETBA